MTFRSIGILFVLVIGWPAGTLSARAECVTLSPKILLEQPSSELVFSGKVVAITRTAELGYRATFDVDRVWKGPVTRRIDLYVWELPPETPRFELGHEYLAVARRLRDLQVRRGAGARDSDQEAFAPVQCSGGYSPADFMRDLGRGHPPK